MLDLLLRHVTARNLVIAALLGACAPFAARFGRYARWRYIQTMYPPVRASSAGADDIKADLERRDSARIAALYKSVRAQLEQARADGFTVNGLEYQAQIALSYNAPGRREQAERLLNEIQLAAPRKKVQYIPLYEPLPKPAGDEDDDTPKAQAAKASKGSKAKAHAKGAKGKKAKKKARRAS